ncbi:MAG TPA: tellurite resistance/C4-dicarboxylate transporter family protein [Candidatus Polarisedimenticolaceae bacterium]|nr:tellurite resistance/C4-dicarboxylate transporter family protein [Candidatus Polarisedimenticolaceae bacterium]
MKAVSEAVRGFFPGYFALVMATGIVSLAAHFCGLERVAVSLLWINVAAYATLGGINLVRVALFPREVRDDLGRHARGAGFLSSVAATSVLGSQLVVLEGATTAGFLLWILAIALWLLLIYTFFTAVTVAAEKPPLETGLNGGWLLAVVSTESLGVLGVLAAPAAPSPPVALFLALSACFAGAMLYVLLMSMILERWLFHPLDVGGMTPPYWINMGALAITTLAGCRLLLVKDAWPPLARLAPFLEGFTLFFWATASWWIPLLVAMGVWRHIVRRLPIAYDPQYWSLVFPLGMYSVATYNVAKATGITFLAGVPPVALGAALVAWVLTFAGTIRALVRTLRA